MSDRLTDAELDRLEEMHAATTPGPWWPDGTDVRRADAGVVCYDADDLDAETIAAVHNALPALVIELREHRKREAAHRAALDTPVDGGDR